MPYLKSDGAMCLSNCVSDLGTYANNSNSVSKRCVLCTNTIPDCIACTNSTKCTACGNSKYLKSD